MYQFCTLYINGLIQYVTFCVWPFSSSPLYLSVLSLLPQALGPTQAVLQAFPRKEGRSEGLGVGIKSVEGKRNPAVSDQVSAAEFGLEANYLRPLGFKYQGRGFWATSCGRQPCPAFWLETDALCPWRRVEFWKECSPMETVVWLDFHKVIFIIKRKSMGKQLQDQVAP